MSDINATLSAFPIFIKTDEKRVTIIGGGEEAYAKARLLAQSSAQLRVISEHIDSDFERWGNGKNIEFLHVPYHRELLAGSALVFAATGSETADRQVAEDARALNILVNVVDRPELCDFYTPALVNRAPVAVAIGTEGAGPVLAQQIRARVDQMLPPSLGKLASLAAYYREAVELRVPRGAQRRRFWSSFFGGKVARLVEQNSLPDAALEIETLMRAQQAEPEGHVALVGAGPGAEDLLTLRAQRLMMEADVIVHDALVPETVVSMGRRDAERIAAGKRKGCHSKTQDEINDLLVELAQSGKRVVRLKCGDPLVFGRAGEELAALRDAGISHEIVPGITAACAAAADFSLPLTLRGVASSMVFTTGHDLKGNSLPDWARLAIDGATVAVYMGKSTAAEVSSRLAEAGLSPDTAVAVVENASLPNSRLMHGTLADLAVLSEFDDLTGPVLTIIGDAVAGADFEGSEPLASRRHTALNAVIQQEAAQ